MTVLKRLWAWLNTSIPHAPPACHRCGEDSLEDICCGRSWCFGCLMLHDKAIGTEGEAGI